MPWSERDRRNKGYGTAEYRRKRLACLRAARWRCEIRLPGCQLSASQADHIDGIENDPHHNRLRAACARCHATVTAGQGNAAKQRKTKTTDEPVQIRTLW